MSSTRSSQSEAAQLQDALEMGKQHFNLLSFTARLVKGRRVIQGSGHVSTIFINVTRDLARWRVWAASLLEWAPVTIQFAGPVQPCAPIMHCAGGLQCLALRARIQIVLSIEVKVRPRESSIIAFGFVPSQRCSASPAGQRNTGMCGAIPLCLTNQARLAAVP